MARFNRIVTQADVEKALQLLDDEPRLLDAAVAPAGTGAVAIQDPATIVGTGMGGRLFSHIDFIPTTGTSEEVLQSYTLPANGVNSAYRGIFIHAAFNGENNVNSKTARIRVGGLAGVEMVVATTAVANDVLILQARLWRFTSATFQGYIYAAGGNAGFIGGTPIFGALDWTTALDVVATGHTPTAASDLYSIQFEVTYLP